MNSREYLNHEFVVGDIVSIGNTMRLFVISSIGDDMIATLDGIQMTSSNDNYALYKCEEELKFLVYHDICEISPIGILAKLRDSIIHELPITYHAECVG